jgi:hypothetical protein
MDLNDVVKDTENTSFNDIDNEIVEKLKQEEAEPVEQVQEEQPTVEQPADAVMQAAEQTVETSVAVQAQLEQALAENQKLKEALEGSANVIKETSNANEAVIIEDMIEMPKLDIASLAYMTEEEALATTEQYSRDMAAYAQQQTMSKMKPYIEEVEKTRKSSAKTDILNSMAKTQDFADVNDMLPQIEKVIQANPTIGKMDNIEEQIALAYAIAKGVNAINTPSKEMTPEEFLEKYEKSTDIQDAIEKARIAKIKTNQQVPTLSASSGAGSTALNIESKPKTLAEADELFRKSFMQI